jgi:hypothetical protein
MVIGGGDKYRVDLIGNLIEHHTVIREYLQPGTINFLLRQPLLDFRLSLFVRVDNRDQVVFAFVNNPIDMGRQAAATTSNHGAVQLAIWSFRGKQVRHWEQADG